MLSIRKIGVFGRTYRHLNRYRQILAVLFKYGFADLVVRLNIDQYLEFGRKMIRPRPPETGGRIERMARAERARLILEELGPTFVKFGQILATRPDLIPVDFIREFSRLQDEVPPFSENEVRRVVIQELGKPPEEIFASFDPVPVAAASIAQVHRATLHDGDPVAVKVQRPGIARTIEIDLEIMLHMATLAERHVTELALHRPVRIVEEFARTIEREIDFSIEAGNMRRMARLFLDDDTVFIPSVYHEYSSSLVLTCEYITGIKISKIDELDAAGLDRRLITRRGADLVLKQVFVHGFFHADPHPGNLFVLPDNVICLLDFGMTGTIDQQTREDFVDLVDAVVHRHEARATRVLLRITDWDQEPDRRRLERDVADFIGLHLGKPLKEIELGPLLNRLLELASQHRLRIPPPIFMMLKAISAVENVARRLDPDFDIFEQARPFIVHVKTSRYKPSRITDDLLNIGSALMEFSHQFPRDLLELARLLRQERLTVRVEPLGLDRILATHDQTSNRVAFAVIIAALLIGSALIVISNTPPLIWGISAIGLAGFLLALILGLWLLVAILRKGSL
jgi:ubiquinone biosynthesis protein